MNFLEANGAPHGCLPQFADLTPKSSGESLASGMQQQAQNIIYTSAAGSTNQGKQQIPVSQQSKYPGGIVGWPDHSTLMQLCEKQNFQAINIPNYNSQNNSAVVGVQTNGLPLRIMPNVYLPATSQPDLSVVKQEPAQTRQNSSSVLNSIPNSTSQMQLQQQQQSAAMAEYLQKLQATTLPLTLQQLMKLQSDGPKFREKSEEGDKSGEQQSNSILNIPSVPVFRNGQVCQNGQYVGAENMMMEINPSDLNVHIESNESGEISRSGVATQTDAPSSRRKVELRANPEAVKSEVKKMKFRAKTGEIKIALGLDGSMLYCCPECSLAFSDKNDIEQHIQGHVQERKYQCKECGAMLKRKEHLDQHMRGHSDERPFKCPVCQKAFKRNEHLTRHYVIHSGDKNFTCNVCAKAFSRKDHLNKHAQTHLGVKRTKNAKRESPSVNDVVPKDANDANNSLGAMSSSDDTNNSSHPSKQEMSFLQHIHHLQKEQNFIQTFSAFKEQALRESGATNGAVLHQQAVNMNEILPQNARYLMPSQLQS